MSETEANEKAPMHDEKAFLEGTVVRYIPDPSRHLEWKRKELAALTAEDPS